MYNYNYIIIGIIIYMQGGRWATGTACPRPPLAPRPNSVYSRRSKFYFTALGPLKPLGTPVYII